MSFYFNLGGFGRPPLAMRSIFALMLREMITVYGKSPGGYLWAILEPVAAIGVLSIVFSIAFKSPSLGDSFPLFYATAYLPYMLFMDLTMKLTSSVRFSQSLLAYPVVSVLDVLVARLTLNFLTHVLVFVIVIYGILTFEGIDIYLNLGCVMNAFGMAAVLALGFGTLNCYLFMRFPIFEQLWQILTRPLVIMSGLFFLLESTPRQFREILWHNPLFHITGELRSGIYSIYDAEYVSSLYIYLLGMILFALGLKLLSDNLRNLIEK